MAVRTSVGTGLWSAVGTWNTGVPVDGDSAVIAAGHEVTFDVDQSAWATGLVGLTITGTLRFITDGTVTYLKMGNNITGVGALYIGNNDVDFIPRPIAPAVNTAMLAFLSGFKFNTTNLTFRAYGYTRRTWSTLAQAALITDSQVVLTHDMDLQQGDELWMGRNTSGNVSTQHFVQSYVAGTKTVTLTAPIGTQARIMGDVVILLNAAIKETIGASGGMPFPSGIARGVEFAGTASDFEVFTESSHSWDVSYCVSRLNSSLMGHSRGSRFSFIASKPYYGSALSGSGGWGNVTSDSAALGAAIGYAISGNASAINCVYQNGVSGLSASNNNLLSDCAVRNCPNGLGLGGDFYNCTTFESSTADVVPRTEKTIHLFRCMLNSIMQVGGITGYTSEMMRVESFDHAQVANAYRAWMLGGIIISDTTTKPTGHLQSLNFQLASATSRMRRDYTFWIENGQTINITVPARKDFAGGTMPVVKLFDADYPDPWLDAVNCAILASDMMTDVVDTWDDLVISYTAIERKQVTLRMEAIGAAGNVYFSPENIEKLLGGGGISRSRIIGGV